MKTGSIITLMAVGILGVIAYIYRDNIKYLLSKSEAHHKPLNLSDEEAAAFAAAEAAAAAAAFAAGGLVDDIPLIFPKSQHFNEIYQLQSIFDFTKAPKNARGGWSLDWLARGKYTQKLSKLIAEARS